ncbi:peptide chain release factor N(5)-glutamine methyltransferase [Rheinheimera sp. MMS21-TC3]|uniref:peptide chain release factor N(5)-glutamine methyltransferase n=1 Tax=Rheinheimera sp. MMS21-TC3 TaxID=3072790 RepID=UPI0028C4FFB6|nr:peptide chain release factor N(5)-glutamine methyltransferase [Rheinheimera sp. MMS21-TC3]WNO61543.1 peptide chain release factor N(5)-glutamine methyltransferase [Rheinheimera sp. MMS21-TC3]
MSISLRQWQQQARLALAKVSTTPDIEARLCLCHVLGVKPSYLYTEAEQQLTAEQLQQLMLLQQQRLSGQPLAYLFGYWHFYDLQLEVAPCTLIPRADTESLVEQALSLTLPPAAQVLDLGTGTGAIALALAKNKPSWYVTAVDYIAEAVALAQRNLQSLQLSNCQILHSNWFSALTGKQFDLIVSNPPYIDSTDAHLAELSFEPITALTAAEQGLADIRYIIEQAPQFLTPNGWLWLEHGYNQAEAVRNLLQKQGFTNIESKQDYGANWRISGGCWLKKAS